MNPIYLDNAATTSVRPEVREAMEPYLDARFGNPSSVHRWGREARAALEEARDRVADALGASHGEIVFTGGGTEADNIAVLGRSRADRRDGGRGGVVCSAIEHKAVLGAASAAESEGAPVAYLGVDEEGRVDAASLDDLLVERPAVVAVMWGNNEVGTIQPVAELCRRCGEAGVVFHTDAVQGFGKVRVRVDEVPVDLLAVSAHKICGPKGIGALFIRDGTELVPVTHGGGQEGAVRPGTQNVAAAVGFGVAASLAVAEQEAEARRLERLRARLEAGLREAVPDLIVNGGGERLPHVLNVGLPGVDPEVVLMALDMEGIAVSSGSACSSGASAPSHVLRAMGRPAAGEAWVRFSCGHETTTDEIEEAVARIPRVIERVREMASF